MTPLIRWFPLFSLLTVTRAADVIGSHDTIKVVDGEDAILPCHLKEPFNVTTLSVSWKRDGTTVHLYRSKADYLVDQDKNFLGRTSLFPDELAKGTFSLTLTNVTELDAGNYNCVGRVKDLSDKVLHRQCNVTIIVEPKQSKGNLTNNLGQSKGSTTHSPGLKDEVIGISCGVTILIVLIIIGAVVYFCKRNANPAPAPEPEPAPEPAPAPAPEPAPEPEPAPAPEPAPETEPAPEPAPAPETMPGHDLSTSPRRRGYNRQKSNEMDNPEEIPLMKTCT